MPGLVVAPMDVRMAAAVREEIGNVAAYCRRRGWSRKTFYAWRARFLAEGAAGLQPRSRRPHCCPGRTPAQVEELIVAERERLLKDGADAGPDPIRWALLARGVAGVPSRSTVAAVLRRRGVVEPQPQKRPRSSYRRFVAAAANELWQSDWTAWALADGSPVAVAGTLDDHSRLLVGLCAGAGDATAELVWAVMCAAIAGYGVPQRSITDNGWVYSSARRGGQAAFEINLRALGCQPLCARPYHPQTCGKIERFWQTLKKWLRAVEARLGAAVDLAELNRRLAVFAVYYNGERPHRALAGRTPAAVWAAAPKARPADRPVPARWRVSTATVQHGGWVAVGRFHVAVGGRWSRHPVTAVQDGDRVAVFSGTRLVRALDLDPAVIYQRLPAGSPRGYRHREPLPGPAIAPARPDAGSPPPPPAAGVKATA